MEAVQGELDLVSERPSSLTKYPQIHIIWQFVSLGYLAVVIVSFHTLLILINNSLDPLSKLRPRMVLQLLNKMLMIRQSFDTKTQNPPAQSLQIFDQKLILIGQARKYINNISHFLPQLVFTPIRHLQFYLDIDRQHLLSTHLHLVLVEGFLHAIFKVTYEFTVFHEGSF